MTCQIWLYNSATLTVDEVVSLDRDLKSLNSELIRFFGDELSGAMSQ